MNSRAADPTVDTRTDLKPLSRTELNEFCSSLGLETYRTDQIYQWLYQKGVSEFREMTNLSKALREKLEGVARISRLKVDTRITSHDQTIKFLFELDGGKQEKVEAVLIPDFHPDGSAKRLTICVSSQVGCLFGCSFCATGKMGFFRNLTSGEITDQVQIINRIAEETFGKGITNIVYMGMGEPLHNYRSVTESISILTDELGMGLSPKRITVSTVGLTKQIRQLADEMQPFQLAISLHAATDEKRNRIMPINESLDLTALEEAVKYYFERTMRPVTYEYLLFDNFNDSAEDARNLAQIAHWIPSKVNIIMYNPVQGVDYNRVKEDRLDRFMKQLVDRGVTATVRRSRGDDIDAGCGQLAIREGAERGKSLRKEWG